MKKYVAFLRGINVGGNNIIKMRELIEVAESSGLKNARTFIQSGNMLFESDKSARSIVKMLQTELANRFKSEIRVAVKTRGEIKRIIENVPKKWNRPTDLRRYIAFPISPKTAIEIANAIKLNEEVDDLSRGKNVLYMSTRLSERAKSGFVKFTSNPLYKHVTMRDYSTIKKVLEKMD